MAIPNEIIDIILDCRIKNFELVMIDYEIETRNIIKEYIENLITEELGFWTFEPERFLDIDFKWESPSQITNAIIDIDSHSRHDFESLFNQLDELGCKDLELRFFSIKSVSEIDKILYLLKNTALKSVELIIKYESEFERDENLTNLIIRNPRLYRILVHSAPFGRIINGHKGSFGEMGRIIYSTSEVDSSNHCGAIHVSNFSVNIETYSESVNFNSCLNRKISVDSKGYIKNCPSMVVDYGNINDTSLHSALLRKNFKAIWEINKDKIDVCKDCEFRYVCTDCRAYITDSNDIYSKPSKCRYDPYKMKWI
ncbi:grasp-with-spasm system SPASM domain peptide maturase [Chryseotalea sanaruensis]|uniref:Grasp-with-spasm system SPASM domain peptide maturase n=2 Tax=Chryseotalea sanaruensis TaxID=2482724 RepID=A0A401U7N9_9BACT|nr:grasp-with-spasm system SPASM domain peptide maturase [Chryseotalea sanaruensis]